MLPNGTDPLILHDGTVINPEDGSVVHDEPEKEVIIEVPNNQELQSEYVAARVRLHDLPVPPHQMNSLSVILTYSLFGVNNEDIGTILGLSAADVVAIKASDTFKDVQAKIVENIAQNDQDYVRNMLVAQSVNAANRMTTLLHSDSENIQIQAAKDILDRSGLRPVDVVEHKHQHDHDHGLVIRYVDSSDDKEIPETPVTIEG